MSLPRFFYPDALPFDEVIETTVPAVNAVSTVMSAQRTQTARINPINDSVVPIPPEVPSIITLPDAIATHAGRSLRLRDGATIVLFNGRGGEYHATLHFEQGRANAHLLHFLPQDRLPRGHVSLAQALPSGDKMDWIIEKNSELGLSHLYPIAADHSILNLSGSRLSKRLERWQRIAHSAAEQCGRNRPLHIETVTPLQQWLDEVSAAYDAILLCHHEDGHALTQVLQQLKIKTKSQQAIDNAPQQVIENAPQQATEPPRICLVIGPEGGWSNRELELFDQYVASDGQRYQRIIWGDRVFRTETAGLALAAACYAILDWF